MEQGKDVTVAAVMTAPRYESVWARNQIERALREAGVPLTISGGVFYGQCMQMMFEQLCGENVDYVLTVDFDAVFTAAHVHRLVSIVAQESEIDALAAIQPMRGKGRVLGSNGEESEIEWQGRPIRVTSAHFGLTVIDLAKLRQTPKPWFLATPDPQGGWGDGKIDDDVGFWRQWEAAGNSLFLDPGCRLGHLEEVVTVFDPEMRLQHIYPNQWSEHGASAVD